MHAESLNILVDTSVKGVLSREFEFNEELDYNLSLEMDEWHSRRRFSNDTILEEAESNFRFVKV